MYVYVYTGADPGFRKGGVRLSILNRRRRRFPESEGRGVERGALPTRLEGLGERREYIFCSILRAFTNYFKMKPAL